MFMRHHDVEGLMPDALAKLCDLMRIACGFVLVHNDSTGEDPLAATHGPVAVELIERIKDVGLVRIHPAGLPERWPRSPTARSWPTSSS